MISDVLTLLFTDIEGSTTLWERAPEQMDQAVDVHFEVLRRVIPQHSGNVVKSTGDGVFAIFVDPTEAVRAAARGERELTSVTWPTGDLRVRMGLHTGECIARDGDHYGRAVNKAARLEQAAYGGQVLLSEHTASLVRDDLEEDLSLVYLGEHHFDGIVDADGVYQLSIGGLLNDHPPLRTRDIGLERLPLELTALIGRGEATPQVQEELRRSRVVSLVGPPGVGKSRLALRVAGQEARARSSGVRFVDLTPCRHVDATFGIIANALGVRPDAEATFAQGIVRALRSSDMLIVLDNCEHLLPAVATLVDLVVSSCPRVTFLNTSRERLDLPYEVVWPVHTLTLPPAHAGTLRQIEMATSVQLLVERARATTADFALTDADVPAVIDICRRCDGLPLAITLAAARLETLTPRELLLAIETSMDVLGQDLDRPGVGRHGGLREALDASYAALPEAEREVLDQLAVFAGFVPDRAIAAVCHADEADVRARLEGLVKRSMLGVERGGGWTRFGLLESVRQYAVEHGRVDDELRARHAAYFVEEAEHRGRQYLTAGAFDAARAMVEQFDDFRLAVQRLSAREAWVDAARIVAALHEFCLFSMRPELHVWAMDLDGKLPVTHPLNAELQGIIAIGAWFRGNHKAALAKGALALEAAEQAEGPVSTIWARTALLNASGHIGDMDGALKHALALREECLATDDPYWIINALAVEAVGLVTVGLQKMAIRPAVKAVRMAEELGNPECEYWSAYAEALALRPTDLDGAEVALERALAAARSNGARFNEGIVLMEQLGVLVDRGRSDVAAATALDLLGHLELAGGFAEIWQVVLLVSRALVDAGRDEPAALLLAAVVDRPKAPQSDLDRIVGEVRAILENRLSPDGLAQISMRAGFLSDLQVVERCREELEVLLRA